MHPPSNPLLHREGLGLSACASSGSLVYSAEESSGAGGGDENWGAGLGTSGVPGQTQTWNDRREERTSWFRTGVSKSFSGEG